MKYLKMLGLLAVAAAALMAFVGTAAATTATSPAGTAFTGTYRGEAEGATSLHIPTLGVTITCNQSTVEGKIEQHGSGVTTKGKVSSLTFTQCGTSHITVKALGSLEAHSTVSGGTANGTLTSTGAEITITNTSVGVSCTYTTNNTDIGTGSLTSTATTGGNATLDVASSVIPRTGHSAFCGSSGTWTGSYKVTTPSTLYIDA